MQGFSQTIYVNNIKEFFVDTELLDDKYYYYYYYHFNKVKMLITLTIKKRMTKDDFDTNRAKNSAYRLLHDTSRCLMHSISTDVVTLHRTRLNALNSAMKQTAVSATPVVLSTVTVQQS